MVIFVGLILEGINFHFATVETLKFSGRECFDKVYKFVQQYIYVFSVSLIIVYLNLNVEIFHNKSSREHPERIILMT